MKHKFSSMGRVAIALVLALSLTLVMAVPVAAAEEPTGYSFATGGDGTAGWSPAQSTSEGNYSVRLGVTDFVGGLMPDGGEVNIYIEPTPLTDITINPTFFARGVIEKESGIWPPTPEWENRGPYLNILLDTDDDFTTVEETLEGAIANIVLGEEYDPESFVEVGSDYYVVDGVWYNIGDYKTFAEAKIILANENPDTTYTVVGVQIRLGDSWYTAPNQVVYIDDVQVNDETYDLEPPLPPLDEDFYSVGDTPLVTIYDVAANIDPMAIDTIEIPDEANGELHVDSTTDTIGDDLELTETGADTGVFTGSFTLLDEAPADRDLDQIVALDGDEITLTYLALSVTAEVDDTAPKITVLEPLVDGATTDNRTPDISATYEDDPDVSGIDEDSVQIIFDGVDVTDDDATTTVTVSTVTYTPEDDLDDGTYDVTVNVSDNAGNAAITETWSFRVVSWLVDPEGPSVSPLDALETVGVAVSITGADAAEITVGHYASNPEPEASLTFDMIDDGFFDVKVLDAENATQIVIKFADANITAESTAYVWSELQGMWLACDDQGYNPTDEFLWVKVRTDTTPNIAELEGTPFAISGEPAVDNISAYYKGYSGEAEVVDTADLLKAANDWAGEVVPSGFTDPISSIELIALANEWAATE